MAELRFQVARNEIELGEFSRAEITELVETGFLLAGDHCRADGQVERQTVAALIQPTAPVSKLLFTRAANATAGVANALRSQAASLGDRIVSATRRQAVQVSGGTERLLELSLPRLQNQVADVLGRTMKSTSATLRDEVFLKKLFGAVYDTLPRPIYRFMSEEAFLAFCFKHQRKLLPPKPEPGTTE